MNRDRIDDCGKPFEPETPESFFQRGEEAFQSWWSEFDPPGSSGGLELDYDTARAVWAAAYDHGAACITLVCDGAETNAEGAHSTGEMHLSCVVDQHHKGVLRYPAATSSVGSPSMKTIFGTHTPKTNAMPTQTC